MDVYTRNGSVYQDCTESYIADQATSFNHSITSKANPQIYAVNTSNYDNNKRQKQTKNKQKTKTKQTNKLIFVNTLWTLYR